MENYLAINCGSTSLKYKLFDGQEREIKAGNFELGSKEEIEKVLKNVLREIGDLRDVKAVGHRVVHGGEKFQQAVLIDEEKLTELKELNPLAPLHNPYNIAGIEAVASFLPEIPQVAVFDTAFYADLPEVARTYALPAEVNKRLGIRRFGFHGISHRYAAEEAARELGLRPDKINLISCHLGGGWSVTAVKKGKPVDTSMGFTPLEGLVMMTRAGDLDAGLVIELIRRSGHDLKHQAYEEVYDLLNHSSGLKGLSGSGNYLELLKETSRGNQKAKLAFDLAVYRLSKYIASYWAVLGGEVDAIVFTGAIGAGDPLTRKQTMLKLKCLGEIKVLPIKANEELGIIREVKRLL